MHYNENSVFDEVSKLTAQELINKDWLEIYAFEVRFLKEEADARKIYLDAKRGYEKAKLGVRWIAGVKREKITRMEGKNG